MTTYTITLNERSQWGENLLNYLSNLPVKLTKTTTKHRRRTGLKEAEEDIRLGRVTSYKSVDDLFNELGINVHN